MKDGLAKRIVKELTGKDSVLKENLSVIYTGDRLKPAMESYRKKLLKQYAAAALVTIVLASAAFLSAHFSDLSISQIPRPGAGSAEKSVPVKVEAEYKGEKITKNTSLNISAVILSEKEKEKVLKKFADGLADTIVPRDEDGRRVAAEDIKLPEKDPDTGINMIWKSSDPDIISEDGKVDVVPLNGKSRNVTLSAELTLDGKSRDFDMDVLVKDDPGLYASSVEKQIGDTAEQIADSTSGKAVLLPEKTDGGIKLRWSKPDGSSAVLIIAVGLLFCFCIYASRYYRAKKNAKRYRAAVAADFPEVVDKLTLLLNSGLTVFSALMRISQDYERHEIYGRSPAAVEIAAIGKRVESTNSSIVEEWKEFAARMESGELLRFCTILEDNMSKGSELCRKLENESDELRDMKKKSMQQYIRSIDSKMMFPMLIMLFSLILVTISPVITGF